jgi:hypothetical protein
VAVRTLEKAGFRILRQGKHIVMTDGVRKITIPRHNPVNAITWLGSSALLASPSRNSASCSDRLPFAKPTMTRAEDAGKVPSVCQAASDSVFAEAAIVLHGRKFSRLIAATLRAQALRRRATGRFVILWKPRGL